MKRLVLIIVIVLFGMNSVGFSSTALQSSLAVVVQDDKRKGDRPKKDPPGPPIVRDKEPPKGKGDDRPKRGKKPD